MSRRKRTDGSEIEWNFFSFPVIFAFFIGAFVATLLYPVGPLVFIVSLFGASFGAAHIISHWVRRRGSYRQKQREEEEERERRAHIARDTAARAGEEASPRRRRRRNRRGGGGNPSA